MHSHFFLFIDIRWFDVLDILLVAYLIYRLYYVVKGTAAINIFLGILSIYVIWKVVEALQMQMLSEILGQFIGVGVIALIIVFQQELRSFLLMLGKRDFYKRNKGNLFKRFFKEVDEEAIDLEPIIKATEILANNLVGGLIILARESNPSMHVMGGQYIGAAINSDLIVSIFQKDSPLHDGAILIHDGQLKMAQCILKVSENRNMPEGTGLRHRSGLGIAELTDVIAIIISEQTGSISLAHDAKLDYDISRVEFEVELKRLINHKRKNKSEM